MAYVQSWSAVPAEVVRRARPGDLVLTVGAGDVTMVAREVLTLLRQATPGPRRAEVTP